MKYDEHFRNKLYGASCILKRVKGIDQKEYLK